MKPILVSLVLYAVLGASQAQSPGPGVSAAASDETASWATVSIRLKTPDEGTVQTLMRATAPDAGAPEEPRGAGDAARMFEAAPGGASVTPLPGPPGQLGLPPVPGSGAQPPSQAPLEPSGSVAPAGTASTGGVSALVPGQPVQVFTTLQQAAQAGIDPLASPPASAPAASAVLDEASPAPSAPSGSGLSALELGKYVAMLAAAIAAVLLLRSKPSQ